MRKKLFLLIIITISLGIIVTGVVFTSREITIKNLKSTTPSLPQDFTYTAHTGCVKTEDNSIASITEGVKYGAGIVEFDLNFNENGEAVLCHDKPTGGEITLEDAFLEIAAYPNLYVNVDLKNTYDLKAIKQTAIETKVIDRIFYTGVNDEFLVDVREQTPDIPYYLNTDVETPSKHTDEYLLSLVKKVKDSGAIGINFNKDNASKELVDAFHENGLLVSIYTVDDELEMLEILSYSPDNITTRNPDLMQEILTEYNIQ